MEIHKNNPMKVCCNISLIHWIRIGKDWIDWWKRRLKPTQMQVTHFQMVDFLNVFDVRRFSAKFKYVLRISHSEKQEKENRQRGFKGRIAPRPRSLIPSGRVKCSVLQIEALKHLLHDGNVTLWSLQQHRSGEIWHDAAMWQHQRTLQPHMSE